MREFDKARFTHKMLELNQKELMQKYLFWKTLLRKYMHHVKNTEDTTCVGNISPKTFAGYGVQFTKEEYDALVSFDREAIDEPS